MWVRVVLTICILNLMSPAETQASVDSTRQRNRNRVAADTSELVTINRILILGNKIMNEVCIQVLLKR